MDKLIRKKQDKFYIKDIKVEKRPERLKALLSSQRWEILKILAEQPNYSAQIANQLKIHEQRVYYHMNQLEKAGIIEVVKREERGGAIAKFYRVKDYAFAIELPYAEEHLLNFPLKEEASNLKRFLHPFISGGRVNCKIIVGSPDPHGPYQVRGRDGHYGIDLALFLGQYGSISKEFSTKLDVDVKAEKSHKENMILVGGPLTNTVMNEINKNLPIKFESEQFPFRAIISKKTSTKYSEDACGLIAKFPNPFNPENFMLVFAGVRFNGTKSAVLALTRFSNKVLETYEGEDSWACVVKGLDLDGDGKIDSIEILE